MSGFWEGAKPCAALVDAVSVCWTCGINSVSGADCSATDAGTDAEGGVVDEKDVGMGGDGDSPIVDTPDIGMSVVAGVGADVGVVGISSAFSGVPTRS